MRLTPLHQALRELVAFAEKRAATDALTPVLGDASSLTPVVQDGFDGIAAHELREALVREMREVAPQHNGVPPGNGPSEIEHGLPTFEVGPSTSVDILDGCPKMHCGSWPQLVPFLLDTIRSGRVKVLLLDLDNVLMRPRGLLGSETQEWLSTRTLAAELQNPTDRMGLMRGEADPDDAIREARKRVLPRRDIDEARMIENDFYELPAGATAQLLGELHEVASEHGVQILGLTARPAQLRESTLAALDIALGPAALLDRVVFSGGKGANKVDRLRELATELGTDLGQMLVVDDLEHNTVPIRAAGVNAVHLQVADPNYATFTTGRFVQAAQTSGDLGHRFEYLLNAFLVAETKAEIALGIRAGRALLNDSVYKRLIVEAEGVLGLAESAIDD